MELELMKNDIDCGSGINDLMILTAETRLMK